MIICGILGPFEILLILIVLVIILFPTARMMLNRRENFTEKLDQLERLERMYRDGTLTKRQFNRQKAKVLRKR
ncbi:MAG: hypothetical protein D4R64_16460 [Porphyromonadaceae bacterium]|nr:MAG: hypothetical protein D4R64_16460 [Porphyromonadaceae bacterium]